MLRVLLLGVLHVVHEPHALLSLMPLLLLSLHLRLCWLSLLDCKQQGWYQPTRSKNDLTLRQRAWRTPHPCILPAGVGGTNGEVLL